MRKIIVVALALISTGVMAQKVVIFDGAAINASGVNKDFVADSVGVQHAAGGRMILKKVTFPTFKNTTRATINISLASAGDRWDKSGSCFIIPSDKANNLLEVMQGNQQFAPPTAATGSMRGVRVEGDYAPALELMRFMTPFGVGHYSDDQLKRKPVYIAFWEPCVKWSQDISQLISCLQGQATIGVWIDSWTPEGYIVSVDVEFEQSELKCDKIKKSHVLPLLNTVYYSGSQGMPDLFAYQDIAFDFTLPKGAKNAKLYYITTGHGGHSGGDEFVKKQNIVSVDGKAVMDFIPWRDDCASFRRFNPGSGVWLIPRTAPYIGPEGYTEKRIEESLASSDISRSGWCPGTSVTPEMVPLQNVGAGNHSLRVSIPKAQTNKGDELNHWLVSAYIVYSL
ncbi:MAG: PNGase F N-terminal domain-containing protein [Mucinivorans sp.]